MTRDNQIIPQSGYLKEWREVIFDELEEQSYSNIDTVDLEILIGKK